MRFERQPPRSSIVIRGLSLQASNSPKGSGRPTCALAWTGGEEPSTTSLSKGYGARSNTRRCISRTTRMCRPVSPAYGIGSSSITPSGLIKLLVTGRPSRFTWNNVENPGGLCPPDPLGFNALEDSRGAEKKKGRTFASPAPPSSSRLGARVAPQRCPIPLAGGSNCSRTVLVVQGRLWTGRFNLKEPNFCLDDGVHLRELRIREWIIIRQYQYPNQFGT